MKEVGRYPQCDGWESPYNPMSKHSIWKIDYWEKIEYSIDIPKFILHKKSNWTDCLSCNAFKSGTSLLCSPMMAEVLEGKLEGSLQSYSTTVSKGTDRKQYYFIYFNKVNNEVIDYKGSEFITYNQMTAEESRAIKFQNDSEMKSFCNALDFSESLRARKIKLKSGLSSPLIRLYGPVRALLISESFKEILLSHQFSGISITILEEEIYS